MQLFTARAGGKTKPQPVAGVNEFWWLLPDLNWGHKALQASALPTELKSRVRINETLTFYR